MQNILALFLLLFIWPFSSGGKTFHLRASNSVPAASGTVQAKRNSTNRNTELDIKVSHLALPSSLTPPENVYIVWVRPRGETAVKQGAIGLDSNLNGELKTVTTSENCEVFITAEPNESVTAPSGAEVLSAHVQIGP